ncbi:MAG TPA: amidohydrolase [Bryobacteraceae bacterium]|jgi:aminobenzoyl-glutamate utilization protein B|nr:amidohydrolase [Bryobacteraceae bacterium]
MKSFRAFWILLLPCLCLCETPGAHQQLEKLVDSNSAEYSKVSKEIWGYAELGYHEEKSSTLLQSELKKAGFEVKAGVADEPTGFVASYGSGKPVIAMLGEFDALPGLSQASVPDRSPVTENAPGHGCGHNLLGSGAALAAVAVKEYMEANHVQGTLRYYGTPAEEGGSGKVYMLRAGLFRDVDVVLHWHPGDRNAVNNGGMLAITTARFKFHGIAAHAAAAPDRGRSALDAVMLMGNGIEFMREHVPSTTRIHYIISNGGQAPNIVPETAEMYLFARSPNLATLNNIWARINKIAEGAAMMTETTLEVNSLDGDANIIGNDVLAKVAQKDLEEVGGFRYTPEETHFAEELQKSLPQEGRRDLHSTENVMPLKPYDPNQPSASTDVGDISWNLPTIGFSAATFVPGVAAHTWQAAACAGTTIGQKGMVVSAKAMALTAADLFADPKLVADAKVEFARQMQGKTYRSMIPEGQKPPLDYRK